MAAKKRFLQSLNGDWTAACISVSYNSRIMNNTKICTSNEAYEVVKNVWSSELINLQE